MTTQPSSPFDISPMLKMYMESIELWKKNYENFLKSAPLGADGIDGKKAEVESITSPNDAALLNWQKSGEEVFKRFVQNQMELCHFFGHRCEQYLKLPEQLSQCRSLTELGEPAICFPEPVCERLHARDRKSLLSRSPSLARQVTPLVPPHR